MTTGTSLDGSTVGSTGEEVGLGASVDCWMIEVETSDEAGMTGTSELVITSEEEVATSDTSGAGAELDDTSGSGDEVG